MNSCPFAILTLCMVFAISTEGLKCFSCIYIDKEFHDEEIKSEESCASGNTPVAKLSFDCSTLEYSSFPNEGGVAIGMPGSLSNSSQRFPPFPNDAVFTCFTLTYDGRQTSFYDRYPVVGAFRSCLMFYKNRTIDEECREGKLKDLIATVKQEELLQLLVSLSYEFDENVTDTSLCNCNDNNCNDKSGVSGLISEIWVVAIFAIFAGFQISI